MAHFDKRLPLLAVCFLAALAAADQVQVAEGDKAPPQPDRSYLCIQHSRENVLDVPELFTMVMVNFWDKIQDMSTEKAKKLLVKYDEDHDKRLNMDECKKFIQDVYNEKL